MFNMCVYSETDYPLSKNCTYDDISANNQPHIEQNISEIC